MKITTTFTPAQIDVNFATPSLGYSTGSQITKGDKGDPFTYDDFTPEQLAALVGGEPYGEYTEACDPAEFGRTYVEGNKIPETEIDNDELANILLGGNEQ